jgi:RHS repeat-associated protein
MKTLSYHLLLALVMLTSLPASAQRVYQGNQKGLPPFGTFSGSDFDLVSMSNRNLHAEIPIVSVPQRGRDFSWRYVFDTYSWKVVWFPPPDPYGEGYWVVQRVLNEGGWRLVNPFTWTATYVVKQDTCPHEPFHQYSTKQNWTVRAPDGTKHPTPVTHETGAYPCFQSRLSAATQDGSGTNLTLTTSPYLTYIITLNDGTRVTSYRDANGNLASTNADMLNRDPVVVSNASSILYSTPLNKTVAGPAYTTWTVRDSNGGTQVYRLDYTAIDIQTALCQYVISFDPCTEYSSGWLVPSKLTLPTGQVYEFFWTNNSLGQLSRINLPTGGYIEYTYNVRTDELPEAPHHEGGTLDAIAAVTGRKINGVAPGWTYTGQDWVTATDPNLNQTVHENNYVTVANVESGSTVETKVRVYAGAETSGTLLRTFVRDYTGEVDPISERLTNLRVVRETTILENSLQSKVETDYETFTYPPYSNIGMRLNVLERREYAYGTGAPGALVRKTVNTYLHTGNQPYLDRNIVNRAATSKIYDGASALKAQATFEYDNYTEGIQSTTAVQHDSAYGSTFTTRGNLTAVKRWRNTDGAWLETRHQYDDVGNIIKTKDPGNHTTLFDYTDNWAVTACAPAGQGRAYVKTVTNALNHTVTTKYDSCTGLIREVTDANARVTALTYDLMNRPDQTNLPLGEAVDLDLDYDDAARIVTSKTLRDAGTFIYQKTRFDSLARPWRVELCEDGSPSCTTSVKTDTKYDDFGRTWKVWNPTRVCDPQVDENNCASESTFGKTETLYDPLSRVSKVIPPDGTSSSNHVLTTFSGNTVTVTDQAGKKRKSETDALGRLIRVWEPNAAGNWAYETVYEYDVLDNLTRVDQKGGSPNSADWRTRTFTYNSLSQLLSATNPESGTITYAYDNDGNLLTKTAPKPNQTLAATVTTTYTYDVLHRLIEKSYNDGSTATVKYGYDNIALSGCTTTPPALTITNGIGRRTSMCDGSGATSWTFDALGQVTKEKRTIAGATPQTKEISYVYTLHGQVKTLIYPSGSSVTYTYDSAGRPVSVVDSGCCNFLTDATYAPHGALASYKNGVVSGGFAGVTTTLTYNNRLQPKHVVATTGPALTPNPDECGTPGNVLHFRYLFSEGLANNGNVARVENCWTSARSQSFSYDELNRLLTAQSDGPTWGNSYVYDAWGNLTNMNAVPGKSNYQNLQAAPASVKNQLNGHCHDAAGNLLRVGACGSADYTYDAENRMVTAGGYTYVYDGDGKRVKKFSGATGRLYWTGVGPDAIQESDLAFGALERYVFFGGKRIARRLWTGAVQYYFADHLGTSRVVTNATGGQLDDQDFYPYGAIVPGGTSTSGQNYKFTGKERDGESGLDYFIARHYGSNWGRFLQADEFTGGPVDAFSTSDPLPPGPLPYGDITNPQSLNKYAYTWNNPLAYTDPDGHFLDFIVDIGFTVVSASAVVADVITQSDQLETDVKALAADAAAIFVPGVTGAGMAVRAASKVDKVVDAAKAGDKAVDAARNTLKPKPPGENAAAKAGREAHAEFAETVKKKPGWQSQPSVKDPVTGKVVKPDARSPSGKPVELKPKTESGKAKGKTQLKQQERATGKKGRVVYYDPPVAP